MAPEDAGMSRSFPLTRMRTLLLPSVIVKRLALNGPACLPAASVCAGTRTLSRARRQTYTLPVATRVSVTVRRTRFLRCGVDWCVVVCAGRAEVCVDGAGVVDPSP